MKKIIFTIALLLGCALSLHAEDGTRDDVEVLYKYQFDLDLQFKLAKGLKLNVSPELRFNSGFEKVILSGGLEYKTFGCIHWGATYRLDVERVESTTTNSWGNTKHEAKGSHRYAFDVTYKEKYGRFTPAFRLRYNNFTDDELDDKAYLRYRAKVDYNIRKSKITPYLSIEAFQRMEENQLYKMRYATGFDLKTGKQTSLSFDYKFDFYRLKYRNANIFGVGYKYRF